MTAVGLTLVMDGPSDACLVPIVEWTVRQNAPQIDFRLEVADRNLPPLRNGLRARILAAIKQFPCDILLIHRDAEALPRVERVTEIRHASVNVQAGLVPVVPVRMSEAWLLSDVAATRNLGTDPNGGAHLARSGDWEGMPDPKQCLNEALIRATELNVRRRGRFNVCRARVRVAELTADFQALRRIESFREFEREMNAALQAL